MLAERLGAVRRREAASKVVRIDEPWAALDVVGRRAAWCFLGRVSFEREGLVGGGGG
jgi:hypothetical protein